jgi:hypothetical protein
MRESGLLHHLIAEEYSRASLAKIEDILESYRTHEILPTAHELFTASPSQALECPDLECPELYFLKQGRYVPNAHTPLAWTQANQALALHLVKKSVEVSR